MQLSSGADMQLHVASMCKSVANSLLQCLVPPGYVIMPFSSQGKFVSPVPCPVALLILPNDVQVLSLIPIMCYVWSCSSCFAHKD